MDIVHTKLYGEKAELLVSFALFIKSQVSRRNCPFLPDKREPCQMTQFFIGDLLKLVTISDFVNAKELVYAMYDNTTAYRDEFNEVCIFSPNSMVGLDLSVFYMDLSNVIKNLIKYSKEYVDEAGYFRFSSSSNVYFSSFQKLLEVYYPHEILEMKGVFSIEELKIWKYALDDFKGREILPWADKAEQIVGAKYAKIFEKEETNPFLINARKVKNADLQLNLERFFNACEKAELEMKYEIELLNAEKAREITRAFL